MPNMVGLRVGGDAAGPGRGPLHAVEADAGRAAQAGHQDVQALCGEWVQVVGAEEVPDDTGLCPACRYGV
ncbi:hypothetical protein [Modestobacter lapidis]|nr:hypothetical protein [Modestobacter lapidis]